MNKIEVNESGLQILLNTLCKNIEEERDLALERYRRQDEQVETNEQFVLQGKPMVDFLKTAADRTDSLMNLTKLIFSAVHKESSTEGVGSNLNEDQIKKMILKSVEDSESSMSSDDLNYDSEGKSD